MLIHRSKPTIGVRVCVEEITLNLLLLIGQIFRP